MNLRIKEIFQRAGGSVEVCDITNDEVLTYNEYLDPEKFAELIVRECINQAHGVANLRGANDDMVYGADTAALRISKYFGVEE